MKMLAILCFSLLSLFAGSKYNDAINQALDEKKRLVVMVSTESCPYCSRTKEFILPDPSVSAVLSDFVFVELDKNGDEYPKNILYTKFVPTFFIVEPKTEELIVERIGYQTKDALIEFLEFGK